MAKGNKGGGRPAGSIKFKMENGLIDEDQIFLYIKRETIPTDELKRFITLCDKFIISVGADTVTDTDIEEIALIYRDRIYMDLAYESFAEAGSMDAAMATQIEKINKSLEVRKSNLGSRFIDRDKSRKSTSSTTFLDLFNNFVENRDKELEKAQKLDEKIKENESKYTKTKDYMEDKLRNRSILSKDADEELEKKAKEEDVT